MASWPTMSPSVDVTVICIFAVSSSASSASSSSSRTRFRLLSLLSSPSIIRELTKREREMQTLRELPLEGGTSFKIGSFSVRNSDPKSRHFATCDCTLSSDCVFLLFDPMNRENEQHANLSDLKDGAFALPDQRGDASGSVLMEVFGFGLHVCVSIWCSVEGYAGSARIAEPDQSAHPRRDLCGS